MAFFLFLSAIAQLGSKGGANTFHSAPHMDLLGWFSSTQRIRIGKAKAATTYWLGTLGRGGA
jgi:hypothetical protein